MTSSITAVPLLGGGREAPLAESVIPARRFVPEWQRRYRTALVLLDVTAGSIGAATAFVVRPGEDAWVWSPLVYLSVSAAAPLVWATVLGGVRSHDPGRLGHAPADRRDVIASVLLVLAAVAWLTWATTIEVPRDYVLLAVAVAAGASLISRTVLRLRLRSRRARGECQQRVLAVGRVRSVDALVQQIRRDKDHAARVVGCCLPKPPQSDSLYLGGVPVMGGFTDVVTAVQSAQADTVAVLPCPELDPVDLRRLAWALEDQAPRFVMIPGLVDVAGPRLAVGPVGNLAALQVRHARLSGPGWLVKGVADRLIAALALILLSPLMLTLTVLIRLTSPGPALFRQTRIGIDGREFTLLKFRTMYQDAEERRAELTQQNINDDGLLFKVRDDPRVTRVGAVLRRWSLDELPQLLNILTGDMSLVGPRPPLPTEVAGYGAYVWRRLAVKPGLTGLWQISGRSDLSWDEAVRLDLEYVDNWSLSLDAFVLARTIPAVLNRTGAY
jgi:exopolysaccharide biosynthesis polyprenyl glycosylphosphotransferase